VDRGLDVSMLPINAHAEPPLANPTRVATSRRLRSLTGSFSTGLTQVSSLPSSSPANSQTELASMSFTLRLNGARSVRHDVSGSIFQLFGSSHRAAWPAERRVPMMG
jgi:hypothetical protein